MDKFNKRGGKDHPQSIKVNQYDINGNFIKLWHCMSDVTRELEIPNGVISQCCSGKQKTAYGFKWEYFREI